MNSLDLDERFYWYQRRTNERIENIIQPLRQEQEQPTRLQRIQTMLGQFGTQCRHRREGKSLLSIQFYNIVSSVECFLCQPKFTNATHLYPTAC